MPLSRLIYFSENNLDLQRGPLLKQLREILSSSKRNNEANNITGALVFDDFWFIQLLEGDRAKVLATYDRIKDDERHSQLTLVQMRDIEERMFAKWWMGLATRNEATSPAFARYEENSVLKLDKLSGSQILELVTQVAKLQPSGLMTGSAE